MGISFSSRGIGFSGLGRSVNFDFSSIDKSFNAFSDAFGIGGPSYTPTGDIIPGRRTDLLGLDSTIHVPLLSQKKPTEYSFDYVSKVFDESGILKFFSKTLTQDYSPDISGYVMAFMVPPDLSGYAKTLDGNIKNKNYTFGDDAFIGSTSKLVPFLASNFTPPSISLGSTAKSGSSGSQKLAATIEISDQMTVSYMETKDLDIYSFHRTWVNYIYEIMEGNILPAKSYLEEERIDYAASFYFVKYRSDLKTITYIGKAIGAFPIILPSAEILGTRTSSELTALTFNYMVSDYHEITYREASDPINNHWLISEFNSLVLSKYGSGLPATVDPD